MCRGLCVKCCYKCCKCKDKCYDNNSIHYKSYCCCQILCIVVMLVIVLYILLVASVTVSGTNQIIGCTIDYHFRGELHWVTVDEITSIYLNGTHRTNPFAASETLYLLGGEDEYPHIEVWFPDVKLSGVSTLSLNFVGSNWDTSQGNDNDYYFFWNACYLETNTAAECYVSSENATADFVEQSAINVNSSWQFKYGIVYYETC
eukprot:45822_1